MNITALYAGLLGLLFLLLSFAVIRLRGAEKVNLGSGGKPALERAIRGHGNFAEYVPLVLVLMLIMEVNGAAVWYLHLTGALLLGGRLLHAYCFVLTSSTPVLRVGGMVLTFASLAFAAVNCVWFALF